MSVPRSRPRSGRTSTAPSATFTGSSAVASPSPGTEGSSPLSVAAEPVADRERAAGAGSSFPAESHIRPAGPLKTAFPSSSTARRPPRAPATTSSPWPDAAKVICSSSELAAACAVLTARTCRYPSDVAVSRRSTPGRTSVYVAVAPSSVGTGNGPGQSSENERRPSPSRIMSPAEPPPENDRPTAAAFGPTLPSSRRTRSTSTSAHVPSACFTRWGVVDWVSVNVPSGFATVVEYALRCATSSTGSPEAAALSVALAVRVDDSTAVAAAAVGRATTAAPATSDETTTAVTDPRHPSRPRPRRPNPDTPTSPTPASRNAHERQDDR